MLLSVTTAKMALVAEFALLDLLWMHLALVLARQLATQGISKQLRLLELQQLLAQPVSSAVIDVWPLSRLFC